MVKEINSKDAPKIAPDLYHLSEDNSNRFYKIPKELCDNPCYRINLTSDAKLIYAMLLDRMELSRKNNWVNDENEIYLLFTKENISNMLGISETTVYKSFKQLKLLGLIKQVRQGLNKPNMIYIGKIKPDFTGICVFCSSGHVKNVCQDRLNMKSIETEYSKTNLNKTEDNQNGRTSDDDPTSYIKEQVKKSRSTIAYYFDVYRKYASKEHPKLRKKQIERVSIVIGSFMSEYSVDEGNLETMIDKHFERTHLKTDYNINHFATEGILANLIFDAGLH